jgi:hypothetical protein
MSLRMVIATEIGNTESLRNVDKGGDRMPQKSHVTTHAKHCAPEFAGRSVDLADARYLVGNTNLVNTDARRIPHSPLLMSSGRRPLGDIAESDVSRSFSGETTANSSLKAF